MSRRKAMMSVCMLLATMLTAFSIPTSAHGAPLSGEVRAVVSSANYTTAVSAGSRASVFGENLSTSVVIANFTSGVDFDGVPYFTSTYLPTKLGGTTVEITDAAGVKRLAPLFFVSSFQINIFIPAETAVGTARIAVTNANGEVFQSDFQVLEIAPGLYSKNSNGSGAPTGFLIRQSGAGNADSSEPSLEPFRIQKQPVQTRFEDLAVFDKNKGLFVTKPFEISRNEEVSLVLFATGFLNVTPSATARVVIDGVSLPATFVTAHNSGGLDRIQVRLPHKLAGRGEVDVTVEVKGQKSNTVKIAIQ